MKNQTLIKGDRVTDLSPRARRALNGLILLIGEDDSITCNQMDIQAVAGLGMTACRAGLHELADRGIVSLERIGYGAPLTYTIQD